jgi:hypothetical protein
MTTRFCSTLALATVGALALTAATPAFASGKDTPKVSATDCKCEKGGKNCTCPKGECKCPNCHKKAKKRT